MAKKRTISKNLSPNKPDGAAKPAGGSESEEDNMKKLSIGENVAQFFATYKEPVINLECDKIFIGKLSCDTEHVVSFQDSRFYQIILSIENIIKFQVKVTTNGFEITAPSSRKKGGKLVQVKIPKLDIMRIVAHFSGQLNVIFIHTTPLCARNIVKELQDTPFSECKSIRSSI